jgi:hypothetical protein
MDEASQLWRGLIPKIHGAFGACVRILAALTAATLLSSCGDDGSSSYALNAYVSGLAGTGLQVTLNGGAPISISANSQTTIARLTNGAAYTVAIIAQPVSPPQACTAANPSGAISGNNVDVTINCVTQAATEVSVDQSVPQSTISSISKIITPSGSGSVGSWIPIDLSGPLGETIAFGLNSGGQIIVASMVTSDHTVFSATTTALALARLVSSDVLTNQSVSSIDTAISDAAAYPIPCVIDQRGPTKGSRATD